MGLQVRIILYAPSEDKAISAARAAFKEIARLDGIMSDYRVDSELTRMVESAAFSPMRVSRELFEVLSAAQLLAEQTAGAFDVTAGPVIRLWRETRRTYLLPEPERVDSVRSLVGWEGLLLDTLEQKVSLTRAGIQVDLGAIAKGYIADRALEVLEAAGTPRALLEMGGDVRLGAPPPEREGWRVRVAHADSAHRFMTLSHVAVASSGDTEQFVEIDGTRYSHVVDPRTGYGLVSRIAATVVAPSGMVADALATALTVLGSDEGQALIDEHYPQAEAYVRVVAPTPPLERAE